MGKTRRQDTRTEKSDRDLIRKLKSILRGKDKEIARLRKELGKRQDVSIEYHELLESENQPDLEVKPKKDKTSCPECGNPVAEISLGKFILDRCTQCNWRKRRKVNN